jgi:hypothetical protein
MASAPSHLWHYLLNPTQAMTPADAVRLRPAMVRLAMLSSPATAAWLLAPVLPLGYEAIPSADVLRDRLQTRYLRAETRRWLGPIAEAGLAVLPLKGFATGLAIYPEPELRGLGDVDLLLRPADLAALVHLLRDRGFVFRRAQGAQVWGLISDASFHPFVAPDRQLAFDLHIHPDDFPLHCSLSTEVVFAEAHETVDAGMTLRIPCDEHLLLMAMSHAARDKYDPSAVRSVVDMAVMLTRTGRAIDWLGLRALAEAGGNCRILRLAVQVLRGLGLPMEGIPADLQRPFRGLAAWELTRAVDELGNLFALPSGKWALQRREWLLTGGPRIAAWRTARRLRGLLRPWPGVPAV